MKFVYSNWNLDVAIPTKCKEGFDDSVCFLFSETTFISLLFWFAGLPYSMRNRTWSSNPKVHRRDIAVHSLHPVWIGDLMLGLASLFHNVHSRIGVFRPYTIYSSYASLQVSLESNLHRWRLCLQEAEHKKAFPQIRWQPIGDEIENREHEKYAWCKPTIISGSSSGVSIAEANGWISSGLRSTWFWTSSLNRRWF